MRYVTHQTTTYRQVSRPPSCTCGTKAVVGEFIVSKDITFVVVASAIPMLFMDNIE